MLKSNGIYEEFLVKPNFFYTTTEFDYHINLVTEVTCRSRFYVFQIKQTGKDIKKEFRSVHADHIMPNGKNWYLVFGFGAFGILKTESMSNHLNNWFVRHKHDFLHIHARLSVAESHDIHVNNPNRLIASKQEGDCYCSPVVREQARAYPELNVYFLIR